MIDEVYKALVDITKSTEGVRVENNKFCASVHFRCVDEKVQASLNILLHNHYYYRYYMAHQTKYELK